MAPTVGKTGHYAITGLPKKNTEADYPTVGTRQNIDEWTDNPDNEKQVYLFVMALDRFQKIDPTQRDSYFQVAGIHGQPNVSWDEDLSGENIKGKSYCTHNTILFPVWHRAYLALYEQRLYEIMRDDIIPKFPADEQAEWREEADTWRLPFWDWAVANESSSIGTVKVPKLAKSPTITVLTDDGKGTKQIQNPLHQFRMPNGKIMREHGVEEFVDPWEAKDELDYGRCLATSRWPDDEDVGLTAVKALNGQNKVVRAETEAWKHGVVNNSEVEKALSLHIWGESDEKSKFGKAAEVVYRLLTVPMQYTTFATTGPSPSKKTESSDEVTGDLNIEFVHNAVHGWVGGLNYGHMSQIPVASFDPLFWLHHCNIDRIFCLWQGLNPDKWFEEGEVYEFAAQDIIGLDIGKRITPETPLRPFRGADGKYLCAWDVQWTGMLGYTYPEMRTYQQKYHTTGQFDQEGFIRDLRAEVNRLYGYSRDLLLSWDGDLKGVDPVEGGIKSIDYAFSIRYKKYAFGGDPFWIKLYLTNEEGKPDRATDDLLAEVYNFSQKPEVNDKVKCDNCKVGQKNNVWATAYISVTPMLVRMIKSGKKLKSLQKGEVLEHLRKNAYWRIIKKDNTVAPSYEVLKVDPQIIGSTNDAINWNDISKAPTLDNFKPEPTITGGANGSLNPNLAQPIEKEPPATIDVPKGHLSLGNTLPFKQPFKSDGVCILESSKAIDSSGVKGDGTQFYLADAKGDIPFLLSVRPGDKQIVFNTNVNKSWGKEERVSLDRRFRQEKTTILVHDQGEGYEVFIDWVHVYWFQKRIKDAVATTIGYGLVSGKTPIWSKDLSVKVYSSMQEVFQH